MKKTIIVCFLSIFIIFIGCENKIPGHELQRRDGKFFEPGQKKPFSGTMVLEYAGAYWNVKIKNGILDGVTKCFTKKNNRVTREVHIKNGKLHGNYKAWHPNKQIAFETKFNNGKVDGTYKKWDKNGNLLIDLKAEDGLLIDIPKNDDRQKSFSKNVEKSLSNIFERSALPSNVTRFLDM